MKVFSINNHTATQTTEFESIRDIQPCLLPTFTDKSAYRAWCKKSTTSHYFLSTYGATPSNLRIAAHAPASTMSGLIVDYDVDTNDYTIEQILTPSPEGLRPRYASKTYSGGWRLYYEFEAPIAVQTKEVHTKFLQRLRRELRLNKLLPALDENAYASLTTYYEIGIELEQTSEDIIPSTRIIQWLEDASQIGKWSELNGGVEIPFELLRERGEKLHPGGWFGGWKSFELGARGTRFWDGGDAHSVIVRETGFQCFTGDKGFVFWDEVFGHDFVNSYRQSQLGKAIEGIYFDGKLYWVKLGDSWKGLARSDIEMRLTQRGLSAKRKDGKLSDGQLALLTIQDRQNIAQTFPFLFCKSDTKTINGELWLNTSKVKLTQPANGPVSWGENFPWISQYLDTLFDPTEQLDYFLSWLAHAYQGAYKGELSRGLALIVSGAAGAGKTFLSNALIGKFMGGREDASNFLVGGDRFNGNLFAAPVWTVDDAVSPSDTRAHASFSQLVKQVTANDRLHYRPMHRQGCTHEWVGRTVITMNDDPESLRLIPETDINILDKIMILKAICPKVDHFPSDKELAKEFPYFAAYLRDYKAPEHCAGTKRFGVRPYHNESIITSARSASAAGNFDEVLSIFRASLTEPKWEGTSTELFSLWANDAALEPFTKKDFPTVGILGRRLAALEKQNTPYVKCRIKRGYRLWTIKK